MRIALIFDCGATNIRTIAVSETGKLIAAHHTANETAQDKELQNGHIWDIDRIWHNLLHCAKLTIEQLPQKGCSSQDIVSIGVTTFGVDGTLFNREMTQLYPIISWKCARTTEKMDKLANLLDVNELYHRNGVGRYAFNTLYKLLWLKEERADSFNMADYFLFISSILNYRLTGQITTDRTMAGTSMMTVLDNGHWDAEILSLLGMNSTQFPRMVNAGDVIGCLTAELSKTLHLPQSLPVVSCGHDTQFALFGSGAKLNQPVLSSGTWEILMMRTEKAKPDIAYLSEGLTTEFDAIEGLFNPGVQWLGSGILEWLKETMFADIKLSTDYYETLIREATAIDAGCRGVYFEDVKDENNQPSLVIRGLSINSSRVQIYRAALEYLARKLKSSLDILQTVSHATADSILCVGGGSKNQLWNQIRADVLNLPVDVVDMSETTVLGAAMFAFTGVGVFKTPEAAQDSMAPNKTRVYPTAAHRIYQTLYK